MADKRIVNNVLLALSISAIAIVAIAQQAVADVKVTIPQTPVEPSLWWKTQRLQEGWVEKIEINAELKQAIVTINVNRWTSSDYLQRFSFLFKLGTEAQKQNFNVLLHNRRDQKIAEYSTIEERWRIDPKSLGADPFRVNSPGIFQQQF
jgi:hypothetical protein